MLLLVLLSFAFATDHHDVGVQFRTEGDLDSARAALRLAIDESPDDTDAWFDLAVTQAWDGDSAAALTSLQEVLERDPTNTGALAFRARVLSWNGEYAASRAAWYALADRHPEAPNIWSGIGDLHRMCGAIRKANLAYIEALTLDPDHSEAAAGHEALAEQGSIRVSGWGGVTFGAGGSGGALVEARLACSLRGTAGVRLPAPTDSASSWAKGVRADLSITRSSPGAPILGAQATVGATALRVTGFVAQGSGDLRLGVQTGMGLDTSQPPTWLAGPTLDAAFAGQAWSRLSVTAGINPSGLNDVIGVASVGIAERARIDFSSRWTADSMLHSLSASTRSPMTPSGQATLSVQATMTESPLVTVSIGWVIGSSP